LYQSLIRPALFLFDPEKVHHFTVRFLSITQAVPGVRILLRSIFKIKHKELKREYLGLTFDNPVGLAAGFDKDAQMIDLLEPFGFGSIEIGTLTPEPQPGNDRPRLFRLKKDKALINRMGFNNGGVAEAVSRLRKRKTKIIVGGNIGKNKLTPNDQAIGDYELAFDTLFDSVDYFVVNVSSPNTPNLRDLQEKKPLSRILHSLQQRNLEKNKRKPILLKIAPDLSENQLLEIVEIVQETKIDGIIATNTSVSREGLVADAKEVEKIGMGGLSGKPLTDRATEVIKFLRGALGKDVCIIGVGGIMTPEDAIEKLKAGANLIQIYSGFIYNGPSFVKSINKAILNAGL
jgi:dihydroorotate dehydrogenase